MAGEEEQEFCLCGTGPTGEILDCNPPPAVQVRHLAASATLSDKEVTKESGGGEEGQGRGGRRRGKEETKALSTKDEADEGICAPPACFSQQGLNVWERLGSKSGLRAACGILTHTHTKRGGTGGGATDRPYVVSDTTSKSFIIHW